MLADGQVVHVVSFRFQVGVLYINIVTILVILHSTSLLPDGVWVSMLCSIRIGKECNRIYVQSIDLVLE